MVRIQGPSTSSISSPQGPDVPALAKQLKTQIDTFNNHLKHLIDSPNLSGDNHFLNQVKGAILALAETSKQINGE
jgi:hypothetical protein